LGAGAIHSSTSKCCIAFKYAVVDHHSIDHHTSADGVINKKSSAKVRSVAQECGAVDHHSALININGSSSSGTVALKGAVINLHVDTSNSINSPSLEGWLSPAGN
jgi:hypothetical protein